MRTDTGAEVGTSTWRTDPSLRTGDSATSLFPCFAISRTPTKSGVEVTAPATAEMVVRTDPSALGALPRRNLVASAASVFCGAAPFAHLNVPAVVPVPMSQWYPVGHSVELLHFSWVTSTWHPAASSSAAANERTTVFCIACFPPEESVFIKTSPPPTHRTMWEGSRGRRRRCRPRGPLRAARRKGYGPTWIARADHPPPRACAATSAGGSRIPLGGASRVFLSFASSSSISFSAFFTAALVCESGFSRRYAR